MTRVEHNNSWVLCLLLAFQTNTIKHIDTNVVSKNGAPDCVELTFHFIGDDDGMMRPRAIVYDNEDANEKREEKTVKWVHSGYSTIFPFKNTFRLIWKNTTFIYSCIYNQHIKGVSVQSGIQITSQKDERRSILFG